MKKEEMSLSVIFEADLNNFTKALNESIESLLDLKKVVDELSASIKTSLKEISKTINKEMKEVSQSLEEVEESSQEAEAALEKVFEDNIDGVENFNKELEESVDQLNELRKEAEKTNKELDKDVKPAEVKRKKEPVSPKKEPPSNQGFGPIFTGNFMADMAIKGLDIAIDTFKNVIQTGVELTQEYRSFEKGIQEVFTLLPNESKESLDALSQEVLDFSKEMSILPQEVVPALYQSISASVPRDNVFDFLKTAQQAAVGGATELEVAVDGLTSIINAYGSEVIDVTQASDLMFTAVKAGKTDFNQLSQNLYNVVPFASALGLGFDNVTAALATMTAQGIPTSVATTQLRQLLVELSDSGTDVAKTFEGAAGKSFKAFIAEGGNLQQAIQIVEECAKNSGTAFENMFGSVEAGSAALALTGNGATKFTSDLNEMAQAAGATEAAFTTMTDTIDYKLNSLSARFETLKLDIVKNVEGDIKRALDLFINELDQVEKNGGLEALEASISETFDIFIGFLEALAPDLEDFMSLLTVGVDIFNALTVSVGQALETAFIPLRIVLELLFGFIEGLSEGMGGFGKRAQQVAEIIKALLKPLEKLFDLLNKLGKKIGEVIGTMLGGLLDKIHDVLTEMGLLEEKLDQEDTGEEEKEDEPYDNPELRKAIEKVEKTHSISIEKAKGDLELATERKDEAQTKQAQSNLQNFYKAVIGDLEGLRGENFGEQDHAILDTAITQYKIKDMGLNPKVSDKKEDPMKAVKDKINTISDAFVYKLNFYEAKADYAEKIKDQATEKSMLQKARNVIDDMVAELVGLKNNTSSEKGKTLIETEITKLLSQSQDYLARIADSVDQLLGSFSAPQGVEGLNRYAYEVVYEGGIKKEKYFNIEQLKIENNGIGEARGEEISKASNDGLKNLFVEMGLTDIYRK